MKPQLNGVRELLRYHRLSANNGGNERVLKKRFANNISIHPFPLSFLLADLPIYHMIDVSAFDNFLGKTCQVG
jgi:hypothetical protein